MGHTSKADRKVRRITQSSRLALRSHFTKHGRHMSPDGTIGKHGEIPKRREKNWEVPEGSLQVGAHPPRLEPIRTGAAIGGPFTFLRKINFPSIASLTTRLRLVLRAARCAASPCLGLLRRQSAKPSASALSVQRRLAKLRPVSINHIFGLAAGIIPNVG